jgi:hypothetical protein
MATPEANLESLFVMCAANMQHQVTEDYHTRTGTHMSTQELTPILENIDLGRAMCANYQSYYHAPLPQGYELVSTEQEISVPIPDTNPQHFLSARLDALIRNKRTQQLYVFEKKTYGARPRIDELNANDQFLAYTWVLTQIDLGPVGGVAYDGMWKRATPPRDRTEADLFFRTLIHRPRAELEEFQIYLAQEATDMANPDLPLYINRRWEGCHDCEFNNLCTSMSRGEDTEHVLRTQYKPRTPYTANLEKGVG